MLSYEVVSLTIESADRIRSFVNYYRGNGASKVTIFHDGIAPGKHFGINADVIECDDAFWKKAHGGRPDSVEDRQRCIYEIAYRNCCADWLLVVDTDEFVVGFDQIEKAIRKAPNSPDVVRIPTAEAVFGSQDPLDADFGATHFRVPQNKYLAQLAPRILYPGYGNLFIRGLLGHAIGKQFIRSGLAEMEIGIHSAFKQGNLLSPLSVVNYAPQDGVFLCHFDAISYPQWREKWDRRLRNRDTAEMGKKRDRQLELYVRQSKKGEEALSDLFRDLYVLSARKFRLMNALGLAFAYDLGRHSGQNRHEAQDRLAG